MGGLFPLGSSAIDSRCKAEKDRLKYYFPVIEIYANCLKSQYDARKKILNNV